MKKLFVLLLCAVSLTVFGQAPNLLNYQAVVKRDNGSILASTNITVEVSIVKDSPSGIVEFNEAHNVTTNNSGLFSLEIGSLTTLNVNWTNGSKFLKISIDTSGGSNFVEKSITKLVSIPYSLHSNSTDKIRVLDTLISNEVSKIVNLSTSPYSITSSINTSGISEEDIISNPFVKIYVNGVFISNNNNMGEFISGNMNLHIDDTFIPFTNGDIVRFDIIINTTDGMKISRYSVNVP